MVTVPIQKQIAKIKTRIQTGNSNKLKTFILYYGVKVLLTLLLYLSMGSYQHILWIVPIIIILNGLIMFIDGKLYFMDTWMKKI